MRFDPDRRDRPRRDRPPEPSTDAIHGGSPPRKERDTWPDQSKRYRALNEKVKTVDPIPLADAVKQLKKFGTTKFNQTVEVSTNLGIDPRQSDQNVRGSVALPHGIGKSGPGGRLRPGRERREGDRPPAPTSSAATTWPSKIKGGFMDFDVALATPDMMGVVGPLGRVLGPRGLMPSPRSGTVTTDITAGVREFKAGKIEFRNDKGGNVAVAVGKLDFTEEQLVENINAFLNHLRSRQAGRRQGDVHPLGHHLGHHEPGHPGPGVTCEPTDARPRAMPQRRTGRDSKP